MATKPKTGAADSPDLDRRQRLDRRFAELKQDRSGVEPEWVDLTRYLLPERGRYLAQTTVKRNRATSSRILDPTGTKAHQRLAAFLMAGITNPSQRWFKLGVGDDDLDDDADVRGYFAECEKAMMRVLASGTFYNSIHQLYEEIAGFGTGAMIALPDFEDVIRFYPLTVGEYWVALNARQEVDELWREYSLTIGQLVEQFGRDACSPTVQSQFDNGRIAGQVVVCHAIEPNRDRVPGRMGWQGRGYVGTYWERGQSGAGVLKTEGHEHRPFIVPRWHALAGDAYGSSGPGMKALPDIKSLQAGVRQTREAGEKLLNPPLQGDARHQNSYIGQLPGDVNWIAGLDAQQNAGLRPIFQVPPNIAPLMEEVQGYRTTVKETFFNDLILAISQMEGVQPRNQMEIMERRNEKMLMLGPVLERFYSEALTPIIQLTYHRMEATGFFKNIPEKLMGRLMQPKFISVLAQAQKSVGLTGMEQVLRIVGSMAPVFPGVLQKFDSDKWLEHYVQDIDTPPDIIVPQDRVDALRQQQQQDAQQARMAQAADTAQKLAGGAQTLSQTDVGGGQNALAAMLGRPGGVG